METKFEVTITHEKGVKIKESWITLAIAEQAQREDDSINGVKTERYHT